MTAAEKSKLKKISELRKILDTLRGISPHNREKLLASLLELKEAKSGDVASSMGGALTKGEAKEKIKALQTKLNQCQKLISELNAHLLREKSGTVLRVVEDSRTTLTFVRTEPLPTYLRGFDQSKVRGTDESMIWFSDILATIRFFIERNSRALEVSQYTYANIQEIYLAAAAVYCGAVGIKCSESTGSQFFKIAQWFMGVNDPRKTICKSKKLLEAIAPQGAELK